MDSYFLSGIAFYRLLLIKYWKVFERISKTNVCFLILAASLLKYALLIKVFVAGLTPKATVTYSCFYEGTFAFFTHRHLLLSSFYLS